MQRQKRESAAPHPFNVNTQRRGSNAFFFVCPFLLICTTAQSSGPVRCLTWFLFAMHNHCSEGSSGTFQTFVCGPQGELCDFLYHNNYFHLRIHGGVGKCFVCTLLIFC
ncbi:hypothetical protein TRVL_03167 [Trypanosoma vivax]|nr:hypothetical protein TRVL_03167 [Trypanosoma vivax]